MTENSKSSVWTPANVVTLIRICLVPVFVVALLSPWPEWFGLHDAIDDHAKAIVAAAVFVIISCTDWIDGYLARSRNEVTDFGKLLDPIADKILVAAALIALIELQVMPAWPVLIILAREFIVSGIRMLAASKGFVIAASWYGKAKTVLQIIAIVLFIVKDSLYLPTLSSAIDNPLYVFSWIIMLAALVMTIISMLDYMNKARPMLFPKGSEDPHETSCDSVSADSSTLDLSSYFDLAKRIIEEASSKSVTIATAESLTGGLIAAALTSVPGSSDVIKGGFVTYAIESKHHVLGVEEALLHNEGAVNPETAIEMAEGCARKINADITVSVTGIAGPGGEEPGKPVGTVFMAIYNDGIVETHEMHFCGDRDSVRKQTVNSALEAILVALKIR